MDRWLPIDLDLELWHWCHHDSVWIRIELVTDDGLGE